MKSLIRFIGLVLVGFSLVGCYKVPGEDDFSAIPATNNPRVTGEKGSSSMVPGLNY